MQIKKTLNPSFQFSFSFLFKLGVSISKVKIRYPLLQKWLQFRGIHTRELRKNVCSKQFQK